MHRRTLLAAFAADTLLAPAAHAAAGSVTTRDSARLAYIDHAAGKPVVLIHGWSLGSAIWALQTEWLASQGLRELRPTVTVKCYELGPERKMPSVSS